MSIAATDQEIQVANLNAEATTSEGTETTSLTAGEDRRIIGLSFSMVGIPTGNTINYGVARAYIGTRDEAAVDEASDIGSRLYSEASLGFVNDTTNGVGSAQWNYEPGWNANENFSFDWNEDASINLDVKQLNGDLQVSLTVYYVEV